MTRHANPRRLANDLAAVTHDISVSHGDVTAQSLVYGQLLNRWERPISNMQHLLENNRICNVLDNADLDAIAQHYISAGKNPGIYFYEEFLKAYDPAISRSRGVHYSPPEVVSYIVRGVESLLHTHLGEYLSDAVVLDPCCGAGTFLKHIETHTQPCPELIGLELSEVACGIASRTLKHTNVIHADSLADFELETDGKTLVVLGNPPYSGHSANPGSIADLMTDYRDGINERNPK